MKAPKRTIGLFLTVAIATVAAGCGSSDEGKPIPQDAATALDRQLASIQSRFEVGGGACGDITGGSDPNSTPVQQTIDSLPDNVDPDVRSALQDSFDRLFQLVEEQCKSEPEPQQTETEQTPTPTETTPTETTPTETETTPTETEEQPPPETTPTEKTPPGQEKKQGETGQAPGSGGGEDGSGGALVPESGE